MNMRLLTNLGRCCHTAHSSATTVAPFSKLRTSDRFYRVAQLLKLRHLADDFCSSREVYKLAYVRGKQWEWGDDHLRALVRRWLSPSSHCLPYIRPLLCHCLSSWSDSRLSSNLLFWKCTDVKPFKSFVLNGLTWVHWANSRITEKESNIKNKENGSDGALFDATGKIPWIASSKTHLPRLACTGAS